MAGGAHRAVRDIGPPRAGRHARRAQQVGAAQTDDLNASGDVGQQARRGAKWGVVAQVAQQLLSVLATMVLARLLTPADFGIVAASITILQLVQLALSFGWQPAIVRRVEVDPAYLSSTFWFVTALGAVLAGVVVLAAPMLTGLIGLSDASPYLAVLGLMLVPGAALVVPQALLQRRLELRSMYLAMIVSYVIYVIVQLGLAWLGAGAWAVIVGMIVQSTVQFVAMMIGARWWPRLVFRRSSITGDLRFAGGLLVNNGLGYGVRNADYWVVGKLMGAAALGAYYVAYVLPQILRLRMTWVAGSVLYPVLVRSRNDPERTQSIYAHTTMLQAWIGFPAMVGLAVIAQPVVEVFFGTQWDAAVGPLRWLALAAMVEFVTMAPPALAQVQGRVGRLLGTTVVRVGLTLTAVVIAGVAYGSITAVAAGVLIATVVWAVVQQTSLARPLGLRFGPLVKGLSVILTMCAIMAVVVALVLDRVGSWSAVAQLLACTVAGAGVYLALGQLLFRSVTAPLVRSARAMVKG